MKYLSLGFKLMIMSLVIAFMGMAFELFHPATIYVPLWFYILIMLSLLFCIYAIFRWGKSTR